MRRHSPASRASWSVANVPGAGPPRRRPRRPRGWLWLTLLAAPLLTAAGDDPPPADREPPLLYIRILAPEEAIEQYARRAPGGRLIPIDRQLVDRVLDTLGERQPLATGWLRSTRFHASLNDDTLRGVAELSFRIPEPRPTLVTLSEWALAAESVEWRGPQGPPPSFGRTHRERRRSWSPPAASWTCPLSFAGSATVRLFPSTCGFPPVCRMSCWWSCPPRCRCGPIRAW